MLICNRIGSRCRLLNVLVVSKLAFRIKRRELNEVVSDEVRQSRTLHEWGQFGMNSSHSPIIIRKTCAEAFEKVIERQLLLCSRETNSKYFLASSVSMANFIQMGGCLSRSGLL